MYAEEHAHDSPKVNAFYALSVRPLLHHGDDHYRYRVSGMLQQFLIP
jgi:hypothetical protein